MKIKIITTTIKKRTKLTTNKNTNTQYTLNRTNKNQRKNKLRQIKRKLNKTK